MKYSQVLLLYTALCSSLFADNYTDQCTNALASAKVETVDGSLICKKANSMMTWSYATYTKTTSSGQKYLYYMQKPDKHVFVVADHGFISFPIKESGKYRYFETMILDQPLKAPKMVQREIGFERWNKLKDCKCDLNCPCWQGLDCTCNCCSNPR